jgi:hypothetical protein
VSLCGGAWIYTKVVVIYIYFRDIGFSDSIHRPGIKNKLRKTQRFGNWILSLFFISGRWIEFENPVSLKVIHHRQNPIVTIYIYMSLILWLVLFYCLYTESIWCTNAQTCAARDSAIWGEGDVIQGKRQCCKQWSWHSVVCLGTKWGCHPAKPSYLWCSK